MSDPHRLTTTAQVREIIGPEVPVVREKLFRELDAIARAFIARSPFLLIATAGPGGRPEVSPKGDPPGFVTVEPDGSLLIPERKGNKLIFTLQNLLANPLVGLIFFVPGTEETLRVQGSVELTADPEVLARLSARGQAALLAIRVKVDTCYFHCAKAFRRSQLWRPETWGEPLRVSFGKMMAAKLGGGAEMEAAIDKAVAEDYEAGL